MGTCMAYARYTNAPNQIQERYIEPNFSKEIAQELKPSAASTLNSSPQTLPLSSTPQHPMPETLDSQDLVLQMDQPVEKQELSKSAKVNKSRFYDQKKSSQGSLNEDSASQQGNSDNAHNYQLVTLNKSKRSSRRSSSNSQNVKAALENDKYNGELSVLSNYYSYSKDPNFLYSQKLPTPCSQGLNCQDEQIISLAQKYSKPTLIQQEVHFQDGSTYNGQWMGGMKHGKGTLTWEYNQYEGDWKFNKFWGKGLFTFKNHIVYQGDMKDNAAEGLGELRIPDGSFYRGSWENNKQHGHGVHWWSKKESYQGNWSNGLKHGEGLLTFEDGSYYKGSFLLNEIHGHGEYHYHSKMTYKGQWEHNEKSGKGQLVLVNGDRYEGSFSHDKMHGQGRYFQADGSIYEGRWINGKREGLFLCSAPDGSSSRSEFYYGKLIRTLEDVDGTGLW